MKKTSVVTIIAIVVGVALFFVLGKFVSIPSPVLNIYISVQYGLLAFMATLFGPLTGFIIGFSGHFLIDMTSGSPHWSWIIASGVAGFVMGLCSKRVNLNKDDFSILKMGIMNLYQACALFITCGVVAPVLDMVMYSEPAGKVFVQGLVACLYDIVSTAIIGTLLCLAYSKFRPAAKGRKK